MKVFKERYEKVKDEEIEFEIPTEQVFYFETGVRRAICITPIYTTWEIENGAKEERIWRLDFILVYRSWETCIKLTSIQLSNIQSDYNRKDGLHKSLIDFMLDKYKLSRTKEQFLADYDAVISECTKRINYKPGDFI